MSIVVRCLYCIKWLKHKRNKRQNCFATAPSSSSPGTSQLLNQKPSDSLSPAEAASSKLLNSRMLIAPVQGIFPTLTPPHEWLYVHVENKQHRNSHSLLKMNIVWFLFLFYLIFFFFNEFQKLALHFLVSLASDAPIKP